MLMFVGSLQSLPHQTEESQILIFHTIFLMFMVFDSFKASLLLILLYGIGSWPLTNLLLIQMWLGQRSMGFFSPCFSHHLTSARVGEKVNSQLEDAQNQLGTSSVDTLLRRQETLSQAFHDIMCSQHLEKGKCWNIPNWCNTMHWLIKSCEIVWNCENLAKFSKHWYT